MDGSAVTICILHYNKLDRLKNTIDSIDENTTEEYKIKILNNGYINSEISEYLTQLQTREDVKILFSDKNLGCPPGRHRLLSQIETPYVMTLDDDMYVEEGWFSEILRIFESEPSVGVVGVPYISPKTGSLVGGARLEIRSDVVYRKQIDWGDIDTNRQSSIPVEHVPGGSMIIRNAVLEDFTWDERYFVGLGDYDKDLQLMESDWRQVMATNTSFYHDITQDIDYIKVRRDYRERRRSYMKFREKWGYRLAFRDHFMYYYLFALPWPIMSSIENIYQNMKRIKHGTY